jgi:outer membrane lipoprotein LolB
MKFLAGLLAVLSLAGCATTPTHEASQSAAALDAWQFMGRVSLTRGEQGWHASLNWQQQGERFFLKISGPLGQGGFQLSGDDRGVVLVDTDGKSFAAEDADVLLAQVAGWQLPVKGLRYWIRGLPAPGAGDAQTSVDDSGRLSQLLQSGWAINYNRYQMVGDFSLPDKLQLLRDDIAVRIVVDKWELGAVTTWLPQ